MKHRRQLSTTGRTGRVLSAGLLVAWFLAAPISTPHAEAQLSTLYDFNSPGDLTAYFNGQGSGQSSVTQATTGGIGNSGSIQVPANSSVNAVYTSKEGYSLGPVGSIYTFATFLKSEGNNGYSGVGFTIKSPADASSNTAYRPDDAFGISVHGGGFIFHNGSTNYSESWGSTSPGDGITAITPTNCSDLINNNTACGSPDKWFKIVFVVERVSETDFDLRVEVWPSDADGTLRFQSATAVFERNGVTNANILAAPQLFSYFSFSGTRVTRFDDYSIVLAGGATVIAPGAPVVLTDSVQVVGNPTISLAGRVTFDGGQAVTGRGFVYSTNPSPTLADSTVAIGTGTGIFTGTTALPASGTYYFRSFASNSAATAYGSEVAVNYVSSTPAPAPSPSPEPAPSGAVLDDGMPRPTRINAGEGPSRIPAGALLALGALALGVALTRQRAARARS